jgi:hypothetical protein
VEQWHNFVNNIGGANSTMSIRTFNLRRSEVTEEGKTILNHPLIYINFFSSTLTQFVIGPSTQYPNETLPR